MRVGGYIRLKGEGEMTACFTGNWVWRIATSK